MKGNAWIPHSLRQLLRSWKILSSNWIITIVNKLVFLLFVSSIVLILWRWRQLPPQVPLFYSRPWGADQLAHPLWLFLLPLGSLFWYGANSLIAIYITHEYLVFMQTLYLTSLITSLLSFVTLFNILFLMS